VKDLRAEKGEQLMPFAVVGSWNVDWLPYTNASCRSAGLRDVHQTQPVDDASAAAAPAGAGLGACACACEFGWT
jgi:hypothetical protein